MSNKFSLPGKRALNRKVLAAAIGCLLVQTGYSQVLEEIVVTAQKREENIQDVPVAVSAISGTFLEDNSIKDVQELMQNVPGLVVGTNQSSGV